jgi:branched-subunit amino acid permease
MNNRYKLRKIVNKALRKMISVIIILGLISFIGLSYKYISSQEIGTKSNKISEINNSTPLLNNKFAINVWYGSPQNFGNRSGGERNLVI